MRDVTPERGRARPVDGEVGAVEDVLDFLRLGLRTGVTDLNDDPLSAQRRPQPYLARRCPPDGARQQVRHDSFEMQRVEVGARQPSQFEPQLEALEARFDSAMLRLFGDDRIGVDYAPVGTQQLFLEQIKV